MAKVEIDVGGSGSGSYISGSGLFTGGADTSNANPIDFSNVYDPAPEDVYQAVRYHAASFSRTLTGLTVGATYRFRVHSVWFATTYSFRTKANTVDKGTLSFVSGTDDNVVKVLEFTATPDGSGEIALVFESIGTFALVAALQYWQNTGGATEPDDVTGLVGTAELAAGVSLAWDDAADDLEVDHYRIQRDTVNTFDSINLATINTDSYVAEYYEVLAPLTTYYYRVKAVDGDGNLSTNWSTTEDVTTLAARAKIDVGGAGSGDYVADQFFTNGSTFSGVPDLDLTGLTDPAPQAVYDSIRVTADPTLLNYVITGLDPNASYLVRLHAGSDGITTSKSQIFFANGYRAMQMTYDQSLVARIREFYVDADGNGEIDLTGDAIVSSDIFLSALEYERADPPADSVLYNIVIMGDSITDGYPYYDNNYPHLLAGLLSANSYKFSSIVDFDPVNIFSVTNIGIATESLVTMADRFDDDAATRVNADPDVTNIFMLLGGSNDLGGGFTAADLETGISNICADAYAAGFDYALVATVTPRSDVAGAGETKRLALNTLLTTNFASYADGIVDFAGNSEFDDTGGPNYSAEAVKVHYSHAGNAIAAQMVFDVIDEAFKTIRLTWNASTDNTGVAGYKVRRATDSGFTTNVVTQTLGNVTTYDDEVLVFTATTFYYKVSAFDAAANESAYSTPANKAIVP